MNVRDKNFYRNEAAGYLQQAEVILNQASDRDLTPLEKGQVEDFNRKAESSLTKADWHEKAEQQLPSIIAQKTGEKVHAVAKRHIPGFESAQAAYDSGAWLLGTLAGSQKHLQHCMDRGLIKNSMSTTVNPSGGFLVPEPLAASVIALREQFGVAEQNATVVTMSDGTLIMPKLTSETTAYYVPELGEITESEPTFTQVKLESKKIATLSVFSSEIGEDSVADVAQLIARSTAHGFAKAMDQAVFNGDATSAFGGILGLSGGLDTGSRVTATGRTSFSALTFADFEGCIGKAKVYGGGSQGAWFISRNGWANSMQRLADAAGGNNTVTLANGLSANSFMGYPVQFTACLEDDLTGTSGKIAAYFGDLRSAVMLGVRRQMTVAVDQSKYFSSDALCVRCTMRWDAVLHDKGTASDSGAVVALVFG